MTRSRATKFIARLRTAQKNFDARLRIREVRDGTVQYYDAEIPQGGGCYQQAIERVVREEKLAGKGKLEVKMVLTGEGTSLKHVVEGEIDLSDANNI